MKHRTSRGIAALTLGAALVLSGCADDSGTTSDATASASGSPTADAVATPTAEDVAAVKAITLKGDVGKEPKVVFDTPLSVTAATSRVETPGTGADLVDGQQISMNYVSYQGSDDTKLGTTWGDTPDSIILGDPSIIPALNDVLSGQKVGVRAIIAIPSTDADGAATTNVLAIEVADAKTIPNRAEGTAVKPEAGLPTVTLDDTGKPSIDIPKDYEEPTDLVVQTLIKGDGAKVTKTQTVTAQYTGWLKDGTVFDSSWERGAPASFSLSQVIAGWTTGLTGQTVGSQVLLIIPPDQGYGDTASGSIPANSTLYFVVDILAAS